MIKRGVNLLLIVAAALMLLVSVSEAQNDYYGAIAYSPSNGSHGYSYNYASQWAAENRACSCPWCSLIGVFHRGNRLKNGRHDADITGAAADVSAENFLDFRFGRARIAPQEIGE